MGEPSGFELAGNILKVHCEHSSPDGEHRGRGGRRTVYRSLPSAAFMLAFAAGEAKVKAASKRLGIRDDRGNPLGLGSAGLVEAWSPHVSLIGRTRVAASGSGGFARWKTLEGADLDAYLSDAVALRNRLAHVGTVEGIKPKKLKTKYFIKTDRNGRESAPSVTLMLAEGFLTAAQDICYLVATPDEQAEWTQVFPRWSKAGPSKKKATDPRLYPLL